MAKNDVSATIKSGKKRGMFVSSYMVNTDYASNFLRTLKYISALSILSISALRAALHSPLFAV